MKNEFLCVLTFGVGVLLVTGCGGGPERTIVENVPVSGTVTLDGAPLADAEVNFLTSEYAGTAFTGTDGTFQLTAQPGENKVFIRKFEGVGADADPTTLPDASDAEGGPKQLVPQKYADPEKTELSFTVPDDGAENADFQLQSK